MNYKQLIAANDWYYQHDNVVWNVAAFALTEEGRVIGLLGVGNDGALHPVPNHVGGVYLHRRQLTEREIAAADGAR